MNLDDSVRINRAWLYKEPIVSVLQASAADIPIIAILVHFEKTDEKSASIVWCVGLYDYVIAEWQTNEKFPICGQNRLTNGAIEQKLNTNDQWDQSAKSCRH